MKFRAGHLIAVALIVLTSLSGADAQDKSPCDVPHFSTDGDLLQRAAATIRAKPGTDVVILCAWGSYLFDHTGKAVHTDYLTYKILTQKGAEGWDELTARWEPWHQAKPTIQARVISPNGTSHLLDMNTIKDDTASDEEHKIYSDGRELRGPLPAIEPGSIVEQQIVVTDTESELKEGTLRRYYFGGGVPVEDTRLFLDAPVQLRLSYEKQLLPDVHIEPIESNGRVRISFDQGPQEALDDMDPNLPSDTAGRPNVTFATGKNWQSVASAYASIVDRQIDGVDLKAEVSRLTQGSQTSEAKIVALLMFLSKEIRYTGIEFGESAIVPHSPAETLRHKYGDCKDKASLMVALLRAASIPANVALLNAGNRQDISPLLPGFGMFDHAIVFVPGSPDYWIDVTDEYAGLGELPIADQGRLALIAKPDTTALVRTPETSADENLVSETREFFLAENGPARVVETTEPHGIYESTYRSYYADADNTQLRKNLKEYSTSTYLSDKLEKMQRTDPTDLKHPFKLTLEIAAAKRGATDLNSAIVAIRIEDLFNRLPSDLLEHVKEEKKVTTSDEVLKKPRTQDYQLPSAFVTEWKYRIVPPAGFQAKQLPTAKTEQVGPGTYSQDFQLKSDGTVEGYLRFTTGKRRMTADEGKELHKMVVALRGSEPILVWFQPKAVALKNEGKLKESLQSYRDLVALHPKEGLHHLQVASALLDAGLGNAARDEARLAVKLDPNSALAQKTLAEILEYDLVGRKMRPGSDYAGAEEAFRAAIKLDPEDKVIVANLALLLEYNYWGLRYGPGAKLKNSIIEYKKLSKDDLAGFGLANNIAFDLFYAGEFVEAEKEAQNLNPQPNSLLAACETVINGSQAGLAEAKKRAASEQEAHEICKNAGDMLVNLREYALAADLEEAGASGETASSTMAYSILYRKARRKEELVLSDDPIGAVIQLHYLENKVDVTGEELKKICSRNGIHSFATTDAIQNLIKQEKADYSSKSRQGTFPSVGADLAVARSQPTVEGTDATGYRVTMWGTAKYKEAFYVVKEEGQYKVLASSKYLTGAGYEILERISKDDLAGARILLDWIREAKPLSVDDDPLSGDIFPRLWTKGKNAEVPAMKVAAASLLVRGSESAKAALDILENTQNSNATETEKLGIAMAKLFAYPWLRYDERSLEVIQELSVQYPESKILFNWRTFHLRVLGRFDSAEQLADTRLRLLPGDVDALRAKAYLAAARDDYDAAHEVQSSILSAGQAEPEDLNSLLWHALFTGKVSVSDIENGVKAVQLSNNSSAVLHTLGCAYAEVAKVKEAKDVLIQAMDRLDMDDLDDNYLYAFGRIAEQYGESEIATKNYLRIKKPEYDFQIPDSSYKLAQIRLSASHASR